MHMALNADEWIRLNTSYCNRLCLWITAKNCEVNRLRSESSTGDLRCKGCNGLHDQAQPIEVALTRSLQQTLEEIFALDQLQHEDSNYSQTQAGYHSDDLGDSLIDEDELDDLLSVLFPEFQESQPISAPLSQSFTKCLNAHKPRKVAVYIGRCRKCGGYMIHAPERQFDQRDEEVYRCFSCSWRTSPGYSWNRINK
ncbi:hypothetical protein GMST_35040 [Geomonas silvestris]|uniref:Uncharacterized protein n=1 Tax=Geomonas silvestris TaxID=2740184 RepID=A0A6V8MNF3_9BACT|nr:hypothetical protein [Geomonas silvestris]GFO61179.1 hypothetical protein GMST_35040 [Geomonas silvestris]